MNSRFLALLLLAPTLLSLPRLTSTAHADIVWEGDYNVARAKALATGKPLFIDVFTDWCGWCKKLDSTVYPDPRVQQLAQNFVMVRLNAEGNGAAFARALRVTGYPTLFFVTARGGQVAREDGYVEAGDFVQIMQQTLVANGPIRPQRGANTNRQRAALVPRPPVQRRTPKPSPQSIATIARHWKKAPEVQSSLQRPGYSGVYVLGDKGLVALDGGSSKTRKSVVPKKRTETKRN